MLSEAWVGSDLMLCFVGIISIYVIYFGWGGRYLLLVKSITDRPVGIGDFVEIQWAIPSAD